MKEFVVLVDEEDTSIGTMEKLEAHQKGLLHRAFSVFIFNSNNKLLLQRRALTKYHSPGLWTNTCCSHPRPNEEVLDAAHRRMQEEMGFNCKELFPISNFVYKTAFDNGLIENEYDHIIIGKSDTLPMLNPEEVCEYGYFSIEEIKSKIKARPENFTYWFQLAIEKIDLLKHLKKLQNVA